MYDSHYIFAVEVLQLTQVGAEPASVYNPVGLIILQVNTHMDVFFS